MEVADKDLCEELYDLSGWLGAGPDQDWYERRVPGSWEADLIAPKYSLGFLLRKLPIEAVVTSSNEAGLLASKRFPADGIFSCMHQADTPEDALCKLAIALFHQNILTPEESK